ncbi:MAG: hypothetical protein LBC41_11985 [Clostridiales bacterium]|nr:hypothetical protein [Clostridiales bacterium]
MRSPDVALEQLKKQSEKHKNDPDYKFDELSRYVRNPALYPKEEMVQALKNESFKPDKSEFSKRVEASAKAALDAIFPEEKLSRDECLRLAKERLKSSRWLAAGVFPEVQRQPAIAIMRERVDDPGFERLLNKFLKSDGFNGILGKKLQSVCWSRELRGLTTVSLGPEFLLGAKTPEEINSSIGIIQACCQEVFLAEPLRLEAQKSVKFLTSVICAKHGLQVLIPEAEVKDTLKRHGTANFSRIPWRGKTVDSLLRMTDIEILLTYNSWLEAFRLKHLQADNAKEELGKLRRILRMSMLHTLAAASDSTVKSVEREMRLPGGRLGLISGEREIVFGEGCQSIAESRVRR